jgi:hypothetical protein
MIAAKSRGISIISDEKAQFYGDAVSDSTQVGFRYHWQV